MVFVPHCSSAVGVPVSARVVLFGAKRLRCLHQVVPVAKGREDVPEMVHHVVVYCVSGQKVVLNVQPGSMPARQCFGPGAPERLPLLLEVFKDGEVLAGRQLYVVAVAAGKCFYACGQQRGVDNAGRYVLATPSCCRDFDGFGVVRACPVIFRVSQ